MPDFRTLDNFDVADRRVLVRVDLNVPMKDGKVTDATRIERAAFTRALAALGAGYVNDAFSAAHRAHASTAGLAAVLPAAAGRLMQAELEALATALERPARPVVAIVGGAKVSTKLELLGNLVTK